MAIDETLIDLSVARPGDQYLAQEGALPWTFIGPFLDADKETIYVLCSADTLCWFFANGEGVPCNKYKLVKAIRQHSAEQHYESKSAQREDAEAFAQAEQPLREKIGKIITNGAPNNGHWTEWEPEITNIIELCRKHETASVMEDSSTRKDEEGLHSARTTSPATIGTLVDYWEAFESRRTPNLDLKRNEDGSYRYQAAQMAFRDFAEGWQAASNHNRGEIPVIDFDLRQAWGRIRDAMQFYASHYLQHRAKDGTTSDVSYLASNCTPDVEAVDTFMRTLPKRECGKRWSVVETSSGYEVHCQTDESIFPSTTYPTKRAAASRILQLLGIGPVAPQSHPERVEINNIGNGDPTAPSASLKPETV